MITDLESLLMAQSTGRLGDIHRLQVALIEQRSYSAELFAERDVALEALEKLTQLVERYIYADEDDPAPPIADLQDCAGEAAKVLRRFIEDKQRKTQASA